MGSGYSKMKKQARLMQEQMSQMKDKLSSTEVEGSSGNGLVTLVINGEKELKKIKIKPECVTADDVEALEDLILAAFNDASSKVEKETPSMPNLPFGF